MLSESLAALLFLSAAGVAHSPAPAPELPDGCPDPPPWQHAVVDRCVERLAEAGVARYRFLDRRRVKRLRTRGMNDVYCHIPQALRYYRGPGEITYSGAVVVNCRFALALATFERIAQEVAEEVFGEGRRITRVRQLGTYNCRRIRAYPDWQSEHSFANAIDLASFVVKRVGTISVERHWSPRSPSREPSSRFLHELSRRLKASGAFSFVLDPDYDQGHRNHFHLDLAPY